MYHLTDVYNSVVLLDCLLLLSFLVTTPFYNSLFPIFLELLPSINSGSERTKLPFVVISSLHAPESQVYTF